MAENRPLGDAEDAVIRLRYCPPEDFASLLDELRTGYTWRTSDAMRIRKLLVELNDPERDGR